MSPGFRVVALAFGVLLMGGQLLNSLHELLVPHEVCAEHGQLVHVSLDEPVSPEHSPDGSVGISAMPGEQHSHEHCVLAARSGDDELAAPAAASGELVDAVPEASTVAAWSAATHGSDDVIALAPKQSPPPRSA